MNVETIIRQLDLKPHMDTGRLHGGAGIRFFRFHDCRQGETSRRFPELCADHPQVVALNGECPIFNISIEPDVLKKGHSTAKRLAMNMLSI